MYVCVFSLQIGGELPVFSAGGDIRQKSTVVAGGEGVREEPVPVLQQNLHTSRESCLQNHCMYAAYHVTTGCLVLWQEGRESERSQCLFYNKIHIHWVKVVYRTTGVCTQLTVCRLTV